ncbi:MAG: hypothetical protein ACPICC_06265, partial [Candidatus Puniceispirillaceae bacterium]
TACVFNDVEPDILLPPFFAISQNILGRKRPSDQEQIFVPVMAGHLIAASYQAFFTKKGSLPAPVGSGAIPIQTRFFIG